MIRKVYKTVNLSKLVRRLKMTEAYCVKCKKTVTMKDEKMTQTAKGTNMAKGKCAVCGTTVCRMMGKK